MRRPNRRPNYMETEDILNWEETADYIVYKEGSQYIAVNGNTGKEDSKNTDATTVIQYAIDNLTSGRTNIERVVLKGAFDIASTIELKSYTELILNAKLTLANGVDDHIIKTTGTVNYANIIGGILDGNKANNAGNIDGIHFVARPQYTRLNNVNVHDCKRHGIYVFNGWDSAVFQCQSKDNDGDGFHVGEGHCEVTWCYAGTNGGNGLTFQLSTHNRIHGNVSWNNTGHGFYINSWENVITNNAGTFNTLTGIYAGQNNNVIVANRSNNNGYYGIRVSVQGAVANSNWVYDNGNGSRDGILLEGPYISCLGNMIRDSDATHTVTGIEIDAVADNCVVCNNTIMNMKTNTITNAGSGNVIRDNIGYVTEKSGTATMLSGNASIAVAHGLSATPTTFELAGVHAEVSALYVSAVGAANFTINKGTAGNVTANRDIHWTAKVR